MATRLNPYLSFRDTARDAMELYRSVRGGELTVTAFGEAHASDDPAEADKVMHAQLETPSGFTLMASDTPNVLELHEGSSISVSLSGDEDAELRRYWDGLSDGGTITMPLEVAPWGDAFGMLTDRYGITWFVNIAGTPS